MTPLIPLDSSRYLRKDEVVVREVEALTPYPFQSVTIPGLTDEEYTELLESVRAEGVRPGNPLVVTPEGEIVDGRARWRAAKQAGIPTVPVQVLEAPTETDYAVWAAREAVARRHLTNAQRFVLVQAVLAILEESARARQRTTQFQPKASKNRRQTAAQTPTEAASGTPRKPEGPTALANLPTPRAPRLHMHVEAAKRAGVSPRQASKMIQITKHAPPEVRDAVATGSTSVHRAYETLREQREGGNGRRQPSARRAAPPATGLAVRADQPVKALRTIAAWISEWLEDLSTWPTERQEQWWRALQDVSDSCDLAFRRREQSHATSDTA